MGRVVVVVKVEWGVVECGVRVEWSLAAECF